VNTFITKHGFWTLMDVIIVDLTLTNMVQQASMMTTHATMIFAQEKR
jgi:hypothetical protein